jgi:hypothetical protein
MSVIINPRKLKYPKPNREEMFKSVMAQVDFRPCKTGLDAVAKMFNHLFPTIEHVILDNEMLLEDQDQQLKQYAELMDKYKLLEKEFYEYKAAREDVSEEGVGSSEHIQADLFHEDTGRIN